MDSKHTWNMAKNVTADVKGLPSDATVYIYDRMPGSEDTHLLAQFKASEPGFSFDFPADGDRVYVMARGADSKVIYSSGAAVDGECVHIDAAYGPKTRAGEKTYGVNQYPSLSQRLSIRFTGIGETSYNKTLSYWSKLKGKTPLGIFDLWCLCEDDGTEVYWQNWDKIKGGTYLKPDFSSGNEYSCKDLQPLVGENGVFNEYADVDCNLMKYWNDLRPDKGVSYEPDGSQNPVTLELMYGCGTSKSCFGYFFYKDEYSPIQILSCPKYIIALDASAAANLMRKAPGESDFVVMNTIETSQPGMLPASDMEKYEAAVKNGKGQEDANVVYKSCKYTIQFYEQEPDTYNPDKIVRKNASSEPAPSYTVPSGYKIGFFLLREGNPRLTENEGQISNSNLRFSLPWMNHAFGSKFDNQLKTSGTGSHKKAHTACNVMPDDTEPCWFVTYKYNDEVIMGVEDGECTTSQGHGTDHDMNDLLFKVQGVNVVEAPEAKVHEFDKEVKMESWIVACEDLGGSYDYDFNDVVFGVSLVAKSSSSDDNAESGTNKMYVTPLAAGGTLPVKLCYEGKPVGDGRWWHEYFEATSPTTFINTLGAGGSSAKAANTVIEIEVPASYRLSSANFTGNDPKMGGFSLHLYNNVSDVEYIKEVTPPGSGDAPQMILLPYTWSWPRECNPINEAYAGVGNGVGGFAEWCSDKGYTSWIKVGANKQLIFENLWRGVTVKEP